MANTTESSAQLSPYSQRDGDPKHRQVSISACQFPCFKIPFEFLGSAFKEFTACQNPPSIGSMLIVVVVAVAEAKNLSLFRIKKRI